MDNLKEKIRQLFAIVDSLEEQFPGRKFTLDGHIVGSIGEVLAAYHYGLTLLPASAETHDAVASNGTNVQIKTTQTKRISISSCPDHLIVWQLLPTGKVEEKYNGPGSFVWDAAGKMQKSGQRCISLLQLKRIMDSLVSKNSILKQIQ